MTREQMIKAILETYDEDMMKKYSKWIKRQSKATLETVLKARVNK